MNQRDFISKLINTRENYINEVRNQKKKGLNADYWEGKVSGITLVIESLKNINI